MKTAQYKLKLNNHYSWSEKDGVYAKGSAFWGDKLLDAGQIVDKLSQYVSKNQIVDIINEFNGFFAIIVIRDSFCMSITDRILSYPSYYAVKNNVIYLGDDIQSIVLETEAELNDSMILDEFSLTGFVTNSDTLYKNVYQVQSGEIVWFEFIKGNICKYSKKYYQFMHRYNVTLSEKDWLQKYDLVVNHAFERCLEVINDKQIVVPLSSGYDSRLVVLALKKLGMKHVITFSYGKKGHKSIEISRRIADKLSYDWHFIEYSNEKWAEWSKTKEWDDYQSFSGDFRVVPHFQDWPAIWEMKKAGLLEPDCFIVGGHAADPIAGSRITITPETLQDRMPSNKNFILCILKSHYNLKPWPYSTSEMIKRYEKRILDSIGSLSNYSTWASAFDAYNENERQAKFIVNIERATEFWGYSWWMPLFDMEYLNFWEEVPVNFRIGERLHIDYINNLYKRLCNDEIPIPMEAKYNRDTKPKQDNYVKNNILYYMAKIWRSEYLKIIRSKKSKRYAINNYNSDPMGWNGILSLQEYINYVLKGRGYFHSIITERYLEKILNQK
jgi:asparagine synthase (glutamine-hydrolysing)